MRLLPEALAEAKIAYVAIWRKGSSDPTETVRAVVEAYMGAAAPLLAARKVDKRTAPFVGAVAKLKVGEYLDIPMQPLQSVRQRFKTVMRVAQNENLKFSTQVRNDGTVRITRNPDGSRYFRSPFRNVKAVEMASLKPGSSIISRTLTSTRSKGAMGSETKITARRILGNPEADWSVKMTTKGVRLTRTK